MKSLTIAMKFVVNFMIAANATKSVANAANKLPRIGSVRGESNV